MTAARTSARSLRIVDQIPDDQAEAQVGAIDPSRMLGMWRNTNHSTHGFERVELTKRDGRIWMRIWTTDPGAGTSHDWGETTVETLFADGPQSTRVTGFTATFRLDHATTQIQANLDHGLTIIAAFTTFTDGSGRLPYLSREFYHPV